MKCWQVLNEAQTNIRITKNIVKASKCIIYELACVLMSKNMKLCLLLYFLGACMNYYS